jgi:L-rhamnonate dehydratase
VKITAVETIVLRVPDVLAINDSAQDAIVIRVHTDAGITGVGEVDSSPEVIRAIIDAPKSHRVCTGLAQTIIGEDPFDIERLWEKMYRASVWFGRRGAAIQAMSGIDLALWDIKGKALGLPLYKLFGGALQKSVPAYASVLMPETPDAAFAEVARWRAKGFKAIKLGWGPMGFDVAHDAALVEAGREAAGDAMELMIDLGFYPGPDLDLGWDASRVLDFARAIEPFHPYWLEEFLPPDDLVGFARVAAGTTIRTAAGENCMGRYEFLDLMDRGNVSIVQPDVTRCGGLTEARRVAYLAADRGLPCIPHAWSTGLIKAASMHLIASIPNARYLEYALPETPMNLHLFGGLGIEVDENGLAHVLEKPGIGVELEESVVRQYSVPGSGSSIG